MLRKLEIMLYMHRMGKGFKIISKCLHMLVSTVGRIMRKWKLQHTTQALNVASKEGCPSKLSIRAGRGVVREATVRTAVTLKDLQSSVAKTGVKTTISRTPHAVGLYEREARKKTLLEKNPHQIMSGVTQIKCGIRFFGQMRQ